jgi:hypothetical protein
MLQLLNDNFVLNDKCLIPGSDGTEVFTFKAIMNGNSSIVLKNNFQGIKITDEEIVTVAIR